MSVRTRDAGSGRFVSRLFGRLHPKTTVEEPVRPHHDPASDAAVLDAFARWVDVHPNFQFCRVDPMGDHGDQVGPERIVILGSGIVLDAYHATRKGGS